MKILMFQLNSYTDWFTHEWHDRDRDFEWSSVSESSETITSRREIDSVPYRYLNSVAISVDRLPKFIVILFMKI